MTVQSADKNERTTVPPKSGARKPDSDDTYPLSSASGIILSATDPLPSMHFFKEERTTRPHRVSREKSRVVRLPRRNSPGA